MISTSERTEKLQTSQPEQKRLENDPEKYEEILQFLNDAHVKIGIDSSEDVGELTDIVWKERAEIFATLRAIRVVQGKIQDQVRASFVSLIQHLLKEMGVSLNGKIDYTYRIIIPVDARSIWPSKLPKNTTFDEITNKLTEKLLPLLTETFDRFGMHINMSIKWNGAIKPESTLLYIQFFMKPEFERYHPMSGTIEPRKNKHNC